MPVAAVGGTAAKYTPVVDGVKDDAYTQSFSFNLFDQPGTEKGHGFWSTFGETATDTNANMYFLWDDKYLYVYVEVLKKNLTDAGNAFVMGEDHPWESECVESRFLWTDLDDASDHLLLSVEIFSKRLFGQVSGPYWDDMIKAGTHMEAKQTSTGYGVEYAITIPNMKEGMKIKAALQVNDFSDQGTNAMGMQMKDDNVDELPIITLGAPLAVAAPEPEPVAPVVQEDISAQGGGTENVHVPAPAPAPAPAVTAAVPPTGDFTAIIWTITALTCLGGMSIMSGLKKKR
jgi:hypothetical protein